MSKAKDDNTPSRVPQFKTIVYVAPFHRCDREADYRLAWAAFAARLGDGN
jgi:hypothetical protein